jgi:hypothetical protein
MQSLSSAAKIDRQTQRCAVSRALKAMRDSRREHDERSCVYLGGAILENLFSLSAQIEYGLAPAVTMKLD